MEKYVVSALKYRPQTFDEVVGQKGVTQTLENAIDKNQLAHVYFEHHDPDIAQLVLNQLVSGFEKVNEDLELIGESKWFYILDPPNLVSRRGRVNVWVIALACSIASVYFKFIK